MISNDLPESKRQLAAFAAKLNAIFAQKQADAVDPRFAALRAAADLQDAQRRAEYLAEYDAAFARDKLATDKRRTDAVEARRRELAA